MQAQFEHIEMPEPLQKLYEEMLQQLETSLVEIRNPILHSQNAIRITKKAGINLKKYIISNPFQKTSDEISFFKFIKPAFYCHLIYYLKKLKIDLRRPTGSLDTDKEYLLKQLARLYQFFELNEPLYEYYRSYSNHLDQQYFLRSTLDPGDLYGSVCLDADPNFTTTQDYKVAKMLANDSLKNYLNGELQKLDQNKTPFFAQTTKSTLKWTDSNTNLIELAYALKHTGSFNNGKADIKQIIEVFETVFDTKLGNTSKAFQNIIGRNSAHTNFLRKLDTNLVRYIQSLL